MAGKSKSRAPKRRKTRPAGKKPRAKRAAGSRRRFKTQTETARALGVTSRMFREWVRREDWPFGRTGPFDARAITAWRMVCAGYTFRAGDFDPDCGAFEAAMEKAGLEHQIPQPADSSGGGNGRQENWSDRLDRLRCEKIELDLAIKRGRHIDRAKSDAAYVGLILTIRAEIESWVESMGDIFEHCDASRIRELSRRRWDAICRKMEQTATLQLASSEEVERIRGLRDESKVKAAGVRHAL